MPVLRTLREESLTSLEFTNELLFITAIWPEYKSPCRTVNSFRCHGNLCLAACYLATTRSLLFVAAGTWLPSRCSAMDVCSGFTIPAFGRHVTIRNQTTSSKDKYGKWTWLFAGYLMISYLAQRIYSPEHNTETERMFQDILPTLGLKYLRK
jgi:hypothetical protein